MGEKHNITIDISQSLIDEALRCVDKHVSTPASMVDNEEPAEVKTLKEQLEFSQAKSRELLGKLNEQHALAQKVQTQLEQFKQRAAKEKQEIEEFGLEGFVKELLPVLDNLERALLVPNQASDMEGMIQGVSMTKRLFEDVLAKRGILPVKSVGQPFDPQIHEAMQQRETNEVPGNSVVEEVVRGYTLHARLVRPALVVVAKPTSLTSPVNLPAKPETT
jgi:molecular chaperone GrpE